MSSVQASECAIKPGLSFGLGCLTCPPLLPCCVSSFFWQVGWDGGTANLWQALTRWVLSLSDVSPRKTQQHSKAWLVWRFAMVTMLSALWMCVSVCVLVGMVAENFLINTPNVGYRSCKLCYYVWINVWSALCYRLFAHKKACSLSNWTHRRLPRWPVVAGSEYPLKVFQENWTLSCICCMVSLAPSPTELVTLQTPHKSP